MSEHPSSGSVPTRAARSWTLVSADGALDVEVTLHDTAQLGAVSSELRRVLGVPVETLWTGSRRLTDDLPVTAAELAHGAVLGLGGPVPRSWQTDGSSALELHVVGGPEAGRTIPLGQGRHVLGRGAEATIRLEDPDVSRRHVQIRVGGGELTVSDLGSTNGSRLDGRELGSDHVAWPAGAVLRLGASALTVTGPGGLAAAVEGHRGGRMQLRPTARMSPPLPDREVAFPREPVAGPPRRLAWVAVALPALAGLGMAWLMRTPTFLFFALLSPVVAVGSWLSDRWSGRRSGRRDRAAYAVDLVAAENHLGAAVRAYVRAAEQTFPDLATLTAAARRRSDRLWSRRLADGDALSVRLGTGPGDTGITRVDPDGTRLHVRAEHLPIGLDLRAGGGLGIVGPRERALGVLRSVVAQLTALHAPGDVDFVLLTQADRLVDWTWTRWLPHLAPGAVHVGPLQANGGVAERADDGLNSWLSSLADRRRSHAVRRPGSPGASVPAGWVVVLVDRTLDATLAATLQGGRDAGILTLAAADTTGELPVPVDAVLRLSGETGDVAALRRRGLADQDGIVVDRLSLPSAAAFARDLAGLAPAASAGVLPRHVRLLDLPTGALHLDAGGVVAGAWTRERDRLIATLGRSAEGPVELDLCRQGPHALIAGTTGSGKSELLQTLIAGLALRHPPDRCTFLLVDYKGGAAFAEAADLPHTVGLVTDLDGQTTARALRSLSAELSRREAVLGEHRVSDIAALPDDVPLARLVIVVDEFATLAEELPSFVPGLVSIAQRGRSLGVHLVLATQRPGGVVSPEIRANCTLRICLRTTDESESRDVLGGPEAAFLPVDQPGRAYLRAGSGEPTELQVARVATVPAADTATAPESRRWTWPVTLRPTEAEAASPGGSDLARLAAGLTRHAGATGVGAPHRPWRSPLPDELFPAGLEELSPGRHREPARLPPGLLDLPDRQAQEPLELDLAEGGAWLAVGGPRSGRTTLLRSVLAEAVNRLTPAELHVHVIETAGGGLAAEAAALPHTGTSIRGDDPLRTSRLIDRLALEVAARRAAGPQASAPLILLLIDGIDAVSAVLDEAEPAAGSAALLRLLRDGAAVGLTCVLTGDRALPGGRLAAAVRERLVLPLPDRAEYAMAGLPARAVPTHRPPGRALVGEEALECQLVLPRPLNSLTGVLPAEAGHPAPLRIAELHPDPALPLPRDIDPRTGALALPVGPGGDEGRPLVVDLMRTGGLLVTGPQGSGRSSALDAFAQHLTACGAHVLRVGHRYLARSGAEPAADGLDPEDVEGARRWLDDRSTRPCVVVADDVGTPAESPVLSALPALGSRSGVALGAAATAGQLAGHYQGPVAHLRRSRSGLLLCPGAGDAEVLGLRLPRTPLPARPGSGWLATGARLERVQVARQRDPAVEPRSR
jgi:S-DNA-T family DNA segregation ATPase FtsK/SpoIIIE